MCCALALSVADGRRWMIQLLSYSVVERRVRLEIGRSTPALEAKQHIRWSLPPRQTLNSSNKHTCARAPPARPGTLPLHSLPIAMQQVYYTICKKAPTTMAASERKSEREKKPVFPKADDDESRSVRAQVCLCIK